MFEAPENSDIPLKLKVLLRIAKIISTNAKNMSEKVANEAREAGATNKDIHDVVLIASVMTMFNRYVEGLGSKLTS